MQPRRTVRNVRACPSQTKLDRFLFITGQGDVASYEALLILSFDIAQLEHCQAERHKKENKYNWLKLCYLAADATHLDIRPVLSHLAYLQPMSQLPLYPALHYCLDEWGSLLVLQMIAFRNAYQDIYTHTPKA